MTCAKTMHGLEENRLRDEDELTIIQLEMGPDCEGSEHQRLLPPLPDDFVEVHILPHILQTRPLLERLRLLATLRCVGLAWRKTIDDTEELYYTAIELEQEEEELRVWAWLSYMDWLPSSDDDTTSD